MRTTECRDEIIRLLAPRTDQRYSIRTGTPNRRPWYAATGRPKTLIDKAEFYVRSFKYKKMRRLERYEKPTMILAKTVCNLRRYYKQNKKQTIRIIVSIYNPISRINWSVEDIGLIWELVEAYTPSLGLKDEQAKAKQQQLDLIREMEYVISQLPKGGKISVPEFMDLLKSWNPDIDPTGKAVGDAMRIIKDEVSRPSNGTSYYHGFHLPKEGKEFIGKQTLEVIERCSAPFSFRVVPDCFVNEKQERSDLRLSFSRLNKPPWITSPLNLGSIVGYSIYLHEAV